jgi:hypothetical protein
MDGVLSITVTVIMSHVKRLKGQYTNCKSLDVSGWEPKEPFIFHLFSWKS